MLAERLCWTDLTPESRTPFVSPADIKILRNDWPYGIDPRITHLVVWTKTFFAADPATGEPTAEAQALIQAFVEDVFGANVPREKVRVLHGLVTATSSGEHVP
jgi:Protein of unknown function (DUF3605)